MDNTLAYVSGVVLSLSFSYIPGLRGWYGKLDADWKRLVMLAALALAAAGLYGAACAGLPAQVACDQSGAWQLVKLFLSALIANQSVYFLSPRP